jgi:hypothetical protein
MMKRLSIFALSLFLPVLSMPDRVAAVIIDAANSSVK